MSLFKNKRGISNEVTVKRGAKGYSLAYKNIINPFIKSWEEKLKSIEPLFKYRTCSLHINNKSINVNDQDLHSAFKKCFTDEGNFKLLKPNSEIDDIEIIIGFMDLRFSNTSTGFNGGSATITFEQNTITISTVSNKQINKLYSEQLSNDEADSLTNSISKWLLNNIESHAKDIGLDFPSL